MHSMQLYFSDQLPNVIQGRVCRQSRLVSLLGAVILLAMFVALPSYMLWRANPSLWIMCPALAFLGLFAKWIIGWGLEALRAENWQMRIAPDGLWINLRSYLNRDFTPAETVVFLPYAEIVNVRQHTVKRSERHSGRTTMWTDEYLDIQLNDPPQADVTAAISAERRRECESTHLGGLITSRSRHNQVPATMPHEDVIRIRWRGRQEVVVPSLKKVLRELTAKCVVFAPTAESVGNANSFSSEDLDQLLLKRIEAGDKLEAVRLLRDERGYGLTEAKQLVNELAVRV